MLFIRSRFLSLAALILAVGACSPETPPARSTITDDFGDTIALADPPTRIVSLNPTTTEILFAIGAGPRVVGRTTYDQFPAEVKKVTDVGPGLRPNIEAVIAVRPQLVILYATNENREAAKRLRETGITTVVYRVDRIADFARVTMALGRLVGDTAAAQRTVDSVQATLARVRSSTANFAHPTVFWPLWDSPLMAVGKGSFLNELIEIAGGRNIFEDVAEPSPTVAFEEVLKRDPDYVFFGQQGRAKAATDARWRTLRAVRDNHGVVIDSTISIGPSVRLGAGAEALARVLHPQYKP